MKELNKQTVKYFIRNKLLEIGGILVFIFGLAWFGKLFGCWGVFVNYYSPTCGWVEHWIQGFIMSFGIIVGLKILWMFIRNNWKKAKKQARRKLKK